MQSMLIVTVMFTVDPAHAETFREAVLTQAQNSLYREAGCRQFDVAVAADDPCTIFLYEVYSDAAAFARHLESTHLKQFDDIVTPWVETKEVRTFNKLGPGV